MLSDAHAVDSEVIIEWRALTVALLDEIADCIRNKLGKSSQDLPLVVVRLQIFNSVMRLGDLCKTFI